MCACAAPRCEIRIDAELTADPVHPPPHGRTGIAPRLAKQRQLLATSGRASLVEPTPVGQEKNSAPRQTPGTIPSRLADQARGRGRNRNGGGESGCIVTTPTGVTGGCGASSTSKAATSVATTSTSSVNANG